MWCSETHGFDVEHAQYTLIALHFPTFVVVTEIMGHLYGKSVPEFQMDGDRDDPANHCLCEVKAWSNLQTLCFGFFLNSLFTRRIFPADVAPQSE